MRATGKEDWLALPSRAGAARPRHRHEDHRHDRHRGRHGNPADLDAYIVRLEDPARDEWQRPDVVVAALGLRRGQTVGEIGGGPGYWSLRLARKVGPAGRVYAVDVEPRLLEVLRQRLEERKVGNVTPVLGLPGDPLLPAASCDLVLLVNAYHHLPDGPAYLRRLARALRRGGRIVNVDFHKRETPVGPPVEERVSREEFLVGARRAGLVPVAEQGFLPHQYCVTLKPRRAPRRR
ncbi:MAG: class I SAM-dependent methyltransferase [Candidatus Rokubacteria bacterium]|nr:class I SAM-dependent methyltransferase [Candidatus Rokubacteria bacterium]